MAAPVWAEKVWTLAITFQAVADSRVLQTKFQTSKEAFQPARHDLPEQVCTAFQCKEDACMDMGALAWSNNIPACECCCSRYGTAFSRTSASIYYLKRIDRLKPEPRPTHLNILADTKTKKVIAAKFRSKRESSDCKDLISRREQMPSKNSCSRQRLRLWTGRTNTCPVTE